jgi:hypothetical protein
MLLAGISMSTLPQNATDEQIVAYLDRWAGLLEQEDYEGAADMIDMEESGWDAEAIRETIKSYDEGNAALRVTVEGEPNPHEQRKEIDRWPETLPNGRFGHVWYDLNIDGKISDMTATFFAHESPNGVVLVLEEIGIR